MLGTVFGKAPDGHDDLVVIGQGPEAIVEQPVSVLAEGEAVAGVVVAGIGELMDVGGVDDAAGGDRRQAIAGYSQDLILTRHLRNAMSVAEPRHDCSARNIAAAPVLARRTVNKRPSRQSGRPSINGPIGPSRQPAAIGPSRTPPSSE